MRKTVLFLLLMLFAAVGNSPALAAGDDLMAVADVQRILNKVGYECGPVDGVKGDRTSLAISKFQRLHNIFGEKAVVDGDTRQALLRAEEEKAVLDYLLKKVPEVRVFAELHRETDLVMYVSAFPKPSEGDGYSRDFYHVYTGVRVLQHSSRMATFLVSKGLKDIFWDNPANGKIESVEVWRTQYAGNGSGKVASTVAGAAVNDWLCIPFQRVGPITPASTDVDLIRFFGADNVVRRTIYVAEGTEQRDVSVIYPDTANELTVFWRDNRYGSAPQLVRFRRGDTAWKTVFGITVGTSLEEANRINGRTFTISGFGWDYGGLPRWEGGSLAIKGLGLRFEPQPGVSLAYYGDGKRVRSDDPVLLPDLVRVAVIEVTLAGEK